MVKLMARIIDRATARLEKLFHAPADDLHAHRLRVLTDARAAPKKLLHRRDSVFARTRVTEKRAKRECPCFLQLLAARSFS